MTESKIDQLMAQAIHLHRQHQFSQARPLYEEVLQHNSEYQPALHNLGIVLLALGELKSGVRLVEQVLSQNDLLSEQTNTHREVGLTLYRFGYREVARPWLEKAAALAPTDQQLQATAEHCAPRTYLPFEVYDPQADEVLKLYSPRESSNYVYVIDIMGTCNLSCPSCPVGNFRKATHRKGKMSLELFKKILLKISQEKISEPAEVFLFNWGEPLLHPDLPRFIECIHEYGLICQLSSNLNVEKGLEEVIQANPDRLKISLSGYTQESYSKTHKGGSIHLVKSNMHRIRYYLDKTGSSTNVWVGYHLYHSSVKHVEAVETLCRELGFAYHPIQAFYQPIEKLLQLVTGDSEVKKETIFNNLLVHPIDNIAQIKANRSGHYDCELRFNQTVINFDGSVALCCGVYDEENMLGIQFLDEPHEKIQALKYQHPFCKVCRAHGLDYSVSEIPERINAVPAGD
jgi:MoaA/NifB/PqqE/SkfB family radical SAM enzyme